MSVGMYAVKWPSNFIIFMMKSSLKPNNHLNVSQRVFNAKWALKSKSEIDGNVAENIYNLFSLNLLATNKRNVLTVGINDIVQYDFRWLFHFKFSTNHLCLWTIGFSGKYDTQQSQCNR